jgi:hypothetical protein
MRDDLVDVGVDVDRWLPAPAAVEGARDATHVHVRVDPSAEVPGDRTHGGRSAPRRVPRVSALHGVEGSDPPKRVVVEAEQVRLVGAHEQAVGHREQTHEVELVAPSDVGPRPFRFAPGDRAPIHDRPGDTIGCGERGDFSRPERRILPGPVTGQLVHAGARPDQQVRLLHAARPTRTPRPRRERSVERRCAA